MSDSYYQQRARRRERILWIAGGLVLVALVVLLAVRALLYDACTRSLERSPRSVVQAYLDAVQLGNLPVAQSCWQRDAYYDLESGCSEICLSKVSGAQYKVLDIVLGEPIVTPQGRSHWTATVSIACLEGTEQHTAELLLDSVGADVPWKHWTILHSGLGGSVADPWCK